jgi:hypothetical protein
MSDQKAQVRAISSTGSEKKAMTDLPQLYSLAEIAAATKYSVRHIARVLRRHPFIKPVGRGRGTRLTLEDYTALIEAMRAPGLGSNNPEPSGKISRLMVKGAVLEVRRRARENHE